MTLGSTDTRPLKPYPGLRPFEQDEWTIFFGREKLIREVIVLMYDHRLVVVHGASGSGKSSLIKAGVLPSLELEHRLDGSRWRIATLKPSEGPLRRLAGILEACFPASRFLGAADGARPDSDPGGSWADRILRGPALLNDIEDALARDGGGYFCLLVDQFEELFRLPGWGGKAEAKLIVEILNHGGDPDNGAPHVLFILTMRSEYLGHCARYDDFAETVNRCQYLLPKMDDFSLLLSIHEPAKAYGGVISSPAAERLLTSTLSEADRLPVLQHALMRACEFARKRDDAGWVVQLADLEAIGGAAGALSKHADEVLEAATRAAGTGGVDGARAEAAEWIFRSLTDLDADGLGVRRTRGFADLVEVAGSNVDEATARSVIERFRAADCNFLAPYGDAPLEKDTLVEISHEALIRKWGRLSDRTWEKSGRARGWLWREFQDGLVWRALALLAQDPSSKLGPAAAEQRLPWFETIRRRPAWTRRYRLDREGRAGSDQASDQGPGSDPEWIAVENLMKRSRRSIVWIKAGFRPASLLIMSLLLAATVGLLGFYAYYQYELSSIQSILPTDKRVFANAVLTSCKATPPWRLQARRECLVGMARFYATASSTYPQAGIGSANGQ